MPDILNKLKTASQESAKSEHWEGTFEQYLGLVKEKTFPNLGVLAHQRAYQMIEAAGKKKAGYFGQDRIKFDFFEDKLFGIEHSIDEIMAYISSAAQRTETSRRMLLLWGPPSSGKSNLVNLLKHGLEEWSRTEEGAIFAIKGSKMHENPFLLIPHNLRDEFAKDYGIHIEGSLCPPTQWLLDNEYDGDFMKVPIERIFMSEAYRVGVGTWLPSDVKSQDISELVGSIDYAKIQEYGDEADPRVFNFDGELFVANRGIMEFIEGLKSVSSDTYIPTTQGIRKIGDIHGPQKQQLIAHERFLSINSGSEMGTITRSCYKGYAKRQKITTSHGYSFTGSIDHRIQKLDINGDIEWYAIKNLQKNDLIPISIFDGCWVQSAPTIDKFEQHKYAHEIFLPRNMTKKLAKFLGYYVAEGSFCGGTVNIASSHPQIAADVVEIVNSFGLAAKWAREKHVICHSVNLIAFLKLLELTGNNSSHKIIPQIILDSPKIYIAEFLRAYFDGDGTVNDHRISCTSSSLDLINQLQVVLLNFGIISKQVPVWNNEYERYYYNLVMDSVHRDKFMDDIGFNLNYKNRKAEVFRRKRKAHRHVISCCHLFKNILSELDLEAECVGSSVSTKRYSRDVSVNALVSRKTYNHLWNWSNNKRDASIPEIKRVLDELPDIPSKDVLQKLVNRDVFFDRIKSIGKEHIGEIYDVHETTGHSYVGNGFIHHNSDEKFLRACLTATQEKAVKAPRFGLVSVDEFIIMHTNESEFVDFMKEDRYEAYHDRMYIVKVPYNLSVSNEVAIYEKLLRGTDAMSINIAPRTLEAAGMFSVLTRLSEDESDLNRLQKMKLYDGQHVKGYKEEQVVDLKKKQPREGLSGVSPRFVIDQISAAISRSREEGRDYVTALDVLRSLNTGVVNRDAFTPEQKTMYEQFIDDARKEWNDLLRNDIQKAFFLEYESEAKALCENYLDQIDAACSNSKPRDPITGEETELDEKLMNEIETQIGITDSGSIDFRNEVLRAVSHVARKNEKLPPEEHIKFDYTQHTQLKEGIQKALFEERKGVIRMTVSSRSPDPEALERLNDVVKRMCKHQDYTPAAANELLKYASAHLFDK